MELITENRTVTQYFKERSRNGVLLLCVDAQGEPIVSLEQSSKGDVEFVLRGVKHSLGGVGLEELWAMICLATGNVNKL